jgi:DNA-binding protein YbaB
MMQARAVCEQMGLDAEALDQHDQLQEVVERLITQALRDAPCPMDAEGERLFGELQ